jgi:hypothetical protein
MGLTSPEVKAGVIKPAESAQAKAIFNKKMPCGGCHEYAVKGEKHGGKSGPSLVGASKRLNPDWVYAFLANIRHSPVRYAGLCQRA